MTGMIFVSSYSMYKLKKIVLLLTCNILSQAQAQAQAQITFSEIMFDVSTNEYHDEFIEIFNLSYSDSLAVKGWLFSDSSGTDQILPTSGHGRIPPRSFAVILDHSYFGNSLTYEGILPDSVVVLTISDNAFGSNGLSNTGGEYLTISDSTGRVLTARRYTPGNIPGFSDEKVIIDEDNDPANWQDSKREGGTPGWRNSVSPPRVDYGFDHNALILPDMIFAGQSFDFTLRIFQYGTDISEMPLYLKIFADLDRDGIYHTGDIIIASQELSASAQVLGFHWRDPPVGQYDMIAVLTLVDDENADNDSLIVEVNVYSDSKDLKINERKYLTDDPEPEWIELVNTGPTMVFLKGWSLMDARDTVFIDTPAAVAAGAFLVLSAGMLPARYDLTAADVLILKKFPSLNDQGDQVSLCSPAGTRVEEVDYQPDWLEDEEWRLASLERINPALNAAKRENWGPSLDVSGGTPGRRNSLYAALHPGVMDIAVSPDPFSPNGDGIDDVALIRGHLSLQSARIKAQIFDIKGRRIRSLEDNQFSGNTFNLVWDGRDDNRQTARIGIYIIYIQILNDRQGILRELKTTVVLAQKM